MYSKSLSKSLKFDGSQVIIADVILISILTCKECTITWKLCFIHKNSSNTHLYHELIHKELSKFDTYQ